MKPGPNSESLLHTLVNEELFKSRERLAALLAKDSPQVELEAEFFHFHGDYVDFAFWLENYEEDPLEGLTPDTPLAKKTQATTGNMSSPTGKNKHSKSVTSDGWGFT